MLPLFLDSRRHGATAEQLIRTQGLRHTSQASSRLMHPELDSSRCPAASTTPQDEDSDGWCDDPKNVQDQKGTTRAYASVICQWSWRSIAIMLKLKSGSRSMVVDSHSALLIDLTRDCV